jgi:hypothetical protein
MKFRLEIELGDSVKTYPEIAMVVDCMVDRIGAANYAHAAPTVGDGTTLHLGIGQALSDARERESKVTWAIVEDDEDFDPAEAPERKGEWVIKP